MIPLLFPFPALPLILAALQHRINNLISLIADDVIPESEETETEMRDLNQAREAVEWATQSNRSELPRAVAVIIAEALQEYEEFVEGQIEALDLDRHAVLHNADTGQPISHNMLWNLKLLNEVLSERLN